jgi:rhodanese-related sulfurtransferase
MAGHIPGSTNIPLRTIDDAELLIENKEVPLYIYCHSGIRSQEAADQLRELGYRNVKNIGGIAMYTGKIVV